MDDQQWQHGLSRLTWMENSQLLAVSVKNESLNMIYDCFPFNWKNEDLIMRCWCRSCWSQHSSFSLSFNFWYESIRNLLFCCPPSPQPLDLWQKRWNKWEYERVLGGIAKLKLCTFIHIHCAFNHCMKWEVWLWEMNSILLHKRKWMREREGGSRRNV